MNFLEYYNRREEPRLPTEEEIETAKTIVKTIISEQKDIASEPKLKITIENGEEKTDKDKIHHPKTIEIPAAAYPLIIDLLQQIAQGNTARIVPVTKELDVHEAAYLLTVSYEYMWQLLDKGKIPYQIIGNCRTIKYEDVMEYKLERRKEIDKALDEMVAHQEALGLYD